MSPEVSLRFLPASGEILYRGSRVALIDIESFGLLRKDLIDTLGIDRAKGYMVRWGYASGARAAQQVKSYFGDDQKAYDAFGGHLMVALEGYAYSTYETKYDRTTQERYGTGVWRNSFEAEEQLKHHGVAEEPVCWFLSGFATGYASVIAPKEDLIYKEVSCVGAGDAECRFVCKPREVWGDELGEEDKHYSLGGLEQPEDSYEGVRIEHEMTKRALSISEQLMDCMLKGESLEELANRFAVATDSAVVIENPTAGSRIIFAPSPAQRREMLRGVAISFVDSFRLADSPSYRQTPELYNEQTHPFQITDVLSGHITYRLCAPIVVDEERYGFLSIMRLESPYTPSDYASLENCVKVFALKMVENRRIEDVELSMQGDYVEALVNGTYVSEESMENHASRMGFSLDSPARVIVIDVSRLSDKDKRDEAEWLLKSIANKVRVCLNALERHLVLHRGSSIVLLVQDNSAAGDESYIRGIAGKVKDHLKYFFPGNVCTMGVGSVCTSVRDYKQSYESAQKALELGINSNRIGEVLSLEQFGAHALLYSALKPDDLTMFAADLIGPLLEYDQEENDDTVETLRVYLENKGNVNRTAQSLHLSYSGLKYRLGKISEAMGRDLKDAGAFINLSLALDILDLMGPDSILAARRKR
ncbi:MAG: XylR N-terminal domain-containing protein [Eggerthellaceae bacterium]|nr:XylR N-terminal domain-containing protein [Eggerthellaceae bacterium]